MAARPRPPAALAGLFALAALFPLLLVVPALLAGATAWLDRHYPPALERYHDRSAVVLDHTGVPLRAFLAGDGRWRLPAVPADVSPLYLAMLVAYEDRRFASHTGVDPLALVRAAGQAVRHGRIVSGASTLTMQAARLLEPRPRTLPAKLAEMARALQLEARLGKDGVLAVYLTLAPFGGNLEGVRAASLAWFGKEPRHLRPDEAALLVALPQAPERVRPDRHPARARAARAKVLERAVAAGLLDAERAAAAAAAPLPERRRPLPMLAPHLAERLVAAAPGTDAIASTLDARVQAGAEALAGQVAARIDGRAGAAVVVAEQATGRVRAWVGSAGYFEGARDGMVDMVTAVRSPGSALKPFIYALAFDRLIAHPATLVRDRPARFGLYAPANFDGGFRGDVTLAEALRLSLNLPAVRLLDRVGPESFDRALADVGVALRFDRAADRASLPIALGGAGVTLLDLATLYAGLAGAGEVRPLRVLSDAAPRPALPLVGATAAWQVADILATAPRPAAHDPRATGGRARAVAFKTGTSYGYRDAWAVGWDGRHVVAAWVGRPDGSPCAGCVGIHAAAPLMFAAFDLLPRGPGPVGPRPAAAVAGPAAALPPTLRRLDDPRAGGRDPDAPRIAFPLTGSTLELGRAAVVPLEVEGGRRPYRWLVDGRPLDEAGWRARRLWRPDGAGYSRITVIDRDGRADSTAVFVRR